MRFKPVPEPPDSLAAVGDAQRAVPLIPTGESDCLRRLVRRTDFVDDREAAHEWLTFLRALGLVERTPSGYRRRREEPTADELTDRLLEQSYGACELYDTLATANGSLSVDEFVDRSGVGLPTWERHHHADHERIRWRRLRRLAEWFVRCGVVDRVADGYLIRSQ